MVSNDFHKMMLQNFEIQIKSVFVSGNCHPKKVTLLKKKEV